MKWTGMQAGEVFRRRRLQEAESAVRAALDERGYPSARVNGWWERVDSQVVVSFEVAPGSRLTVGRIEIVGNRLTRDGVIQRQLLLKPGDVISREQVVRSQHGLYNLGIFRNVRITHERPVGDDPTTRVLRVEVEEAAPMGASVSAGYDTEGGVRGGLTLTHDNVGGRDRSLTLQSRISGIEERYQLLVRDPHLFSREWPALLSVLGEEVQEPGFTVERRSTAFRIDNRLGPKWSTYVRYGYQRVNLFDVEITEEELIRQKLQDLRLGDLAYAVVRDSRDDPFMTRTGMLASVETRLFAPALLSQESFLKLFLRGSKTWTLDNGQSLNTVLRIGLARTYGDTETVPLSERFFAGGDSTVRGFPRDTLGPKDPVSAVPIGGEGLFIFNQEWRVPIYSSLKGVLFYDAGNVFLNARDFDPSDLRHVLGGGLRLETPIGPIRLEYGHKLDRKEGESGGELFLAIGLLL